MSAEDQLDSRWHGAFIGEGDWHFHRRLLERYGIVLAPGEYSYLRAQIKNGSAQVIEQKSDTRAVYVFKIKSANQPVFVMAEGLHFKTALPPTRRLWRLRKKLSANGSSNA
jgi:hypothetical protein